MSGVKGRSGRRPLSIEMKRLAVIQKSWDVADEFLNSPKTELKDKMEHAIKVVVRDIPEQVQHSGNLTVNYGHRATHSALRDKQADSSVPA
jgi:hypothetical protein